MDKVATHRSITFLLQTFFAFIKKEGEEQVKRKNSTHACETSWKSTWIARLRFTDTGYNMERNVHGVKVGVSECDTFETNLLTNLRRKPDKCEVWVILESNNYKLTFQKLLSWLIWPTNLGCKVVIISISTKSMKVPVLKSCICMSKLENVRDDFSCNSSTDEGFQSVEARTVRFSRSNSRSSFSPLDSEALHELSLLRIVASVLSIDPFLGILIMSPKTHCSLSLSPYSTLPPPPHCQRRSFARSFSFIFPPPYQFFPLFIHFAIPPALELSLPPPYQKYPLMPWS